MNTLNKYLTHDYLVTFFMTIAVFTFVMSVGTVIKAIDFLARGVSGWVILKFFIANIPFILTFTIPISSLTTVLLLFSRLSIDGEVTALKACGLSMWQIISAPVMLSIVLSVVCVYLNCWASPNSHFSRRKLLKEVGVEGPINLLEEGRFVSEFPGVKIYIGKKDGNKVKDVVVYEMDAHGIKRSVRAKNGVVGVDKKKGQILVTLYDVRIDQPDRTDPMDMSRSRHVSANEYPVHLDFSSVWDNEKIQKKVADMTMPELIRAIRNVRQSLPNLKEQEVLCHRMNMVVDANERLALSLACFAFTLLGIPLGMRSRRKESSIGVCISLLLVFVFYLFIIIADALTDTPQFHPDLIVWIPVVVAEIVGFVLIQRAN